MEREAHAELEWEMSPWPLLVTVGILFALPFAFSCYFVYKSPMLAVISLGIGVPLIVLSVIGWVLGGLKDIEHHGKEPGYGIKAMPFFILAEACIFLAFFVAYWATRLLTDVWPSSYMPDFHLATPIIMTVILVSSSFTIHIAEGKLEHDDKSGFVSWLIVTMVLGAIFLGISINEWATLMAEGFNFRTNIFSTSFFAITGFHGSHVIVGLCMFLCALIPAIRGNVSKTFVKSASLYWHFVDIIWFFVVTQIYFW